MIEFIGERLFRTVLLLVPSYLRQRHSAELLEAFHLRVSGQSRALGRASAAVQEIGGLVLTALSARRPNEWTRRTAPIAQPPEHDETGPSPDTRKPRMDHLIGDVRFALRTFARRPLTFGFAILSLALGIGTSSAMFSIVDTVLFRPLPFHDPATLTAVYSTDPELGTGAASRPSAQRGDFSWIEFWDLKDDTHSFAELAAYSYRPLTFSESGSDPEQIRAVLVTPSFFRLLGVTPILGTSFAATDPVNQDAHGVLLNEEFWRSRFGGDPHVIGRRIVLNEQSYTVQGVMPREAAIGSVRADLWLPRVRLAADAGNRDHHSGILVIGRMRPGTTIMQAQSDVARVFKAVSPPDHTQHGAALYPLQQDRTYQARPALMLLFAAAGLLLLVGCANVAAILVGLGLERRIEIAIRVSLGASRARIAMQFFTESMVIAICGGILAVPLAALTTHLLTVIAPANVPRVADASLDGRVLLFAFVISLLSGVCFGVIPAVTLRPQRAGRAIASARGAIATGGRAQAVLVVLELALAAVLLVGGTLLGRTLFALDHVNTGFSQDHLLEVRLVMPRARFNALGPDSAVAARTTFFQRFVDEVAAVPGVRGVAVTSTVPLSGGRDNTDVHPEGWQPQKDEELIAERRFVSANFFSTLGIALVSGRGFVASEDQPAAPRTMVISTGLAHRVWPTASALGKQIRFDDTNVAVVVGVVADVRDLSLDTPTTLAFYLPVGQYGAQVGSLVVRASGDPVMLVPAIRNRIRGVDRSVTITAVQPFRDLVEAQVAEQRYRARLMIVFALLAALFSGMGVFGVTARSVARRTREIGIRVALGAEPGRVLGMVVSQGVRLACIGGAAGVLVSLLAGRAIQGMLYGVQATDPVTLIGIAGVVCLIAVVAAIPPALRALRVTPMEALRSD